MVKLIHRYVLILLLTILTSAAESKILEYDIFDDNFFQKSYPDLTILRGKGSKQSTDDTETTTKDAGAGKDKEEFDTRVLNINEAYRMAVEIREKT